MWHFSFMEVQIGKIERITEEMYCLTLYSVLILSRSDSNFVAGQIASENDKFTINSTCQV